MVNHLKQNRYSKLIIKRTSLLRFILHQNKGKYYLNWKVNKKRNKFFRNVFYLTLGDSFNYMYNCSIREKGTLTSSRILNSLRILNSFLPNFSLIFCHIKIKDRTFQNSRRGNFKFSHKLSYTPVIDLSLSEESLWKNLNKKTRNAIRKAQKNSIVVTEETNHIGINEFFRLLRNYYKNLDFNKFDQNELNNEIKNNKLKIFCSRVKDEVCSIALIKIDNKRIGYSAGLVDPKFRKYQPNNLLQWKIITWGKSNDFLEYDLIGASYNKDGDWTSITKFKLGFGSKIRILDNYISSFIKINNIIIPLYNPFKK